MDPLSQDFATGLFDSPATPCLSLYQPTHRALAERQEDTIRFRNLVRALEESLRQRHSTREIEPLLAPFRKLADDAGFWRGRMLDGLAVLGAPGLFRIYQLQRPVPELAIAADSFHVKPLIRIAQSADAYYVLGIDREHVRLFEGNRDQLDEVVLASDFPRSSAVVLGEEENQRYVGAWAPQVGRTGVVHGAGGGNDLVHRAMQRFFRAVDEAVLERYSRPSGRPLVLAGLAENQSRFRAVSSNPFLIEPSIDVNVDSLDIGALRERAWRAIEPAYLGRLQQLVDNFHAAYAREQGDRDVAIIARNAVAGRVGALLVDAERRVPGRFDAQSGAIEYSDLADPDVDDLLDDIAQRVLRSGGEVVMVPKARMPTETGLAAIYRY
ncbi:hypothetical protein [Dokdonella sp.]|uniref:baeRF3 domain-containing protein n=1 Tax=Dokdonella sp. TaxID=2291710 RepID=UPI0031C0F03D|nr:hypothetical protein [Dokdonella sp.]